MLSRAKKTDSRQAQKTNGHQAQKTSIKRIHALWKKEHGMDVILVRMGEMYLKGKNRPFFERQLSRGLRAAVAPFGGRVSKGEGRFYVQDATDMPGAMQAASRVFGVHSVSPARVCGKDTEVIFQVARELLEAEPVGRFRVSVRRADKRFPMASTPFAALIGGMLLESCPAWQVDLHDFTAHVFIELREQAYIYTRTLAGVGGMPHDTNGNALLLLSGGIDSPVAGYLMARRGVHLSAVYFHSFPYTSELAREKVLTLAKILSTHVGQFTLYTVPFTHIQEQIRDLCPEMYGTVLTRRMMMRAAQIVARQCQAQSLVTGESIGQVASQTMEGLVCSDNATSLPVLRPLIATDKLDIMELAKKIDTYETSILPYEDCCTAFTPAHPSTHPQLEKVIEAEAALDVEQLLEEALANMLTDKIAPGGEGE